MLIVYLCTSLDPQADPQIQDVIQSDFGSYTIVMVAQKL